MQTALKLGFVFGAFDCRVWCMVFFFSYQPLKVLCEKSNQLRFTILEQSVFFFRWDGVCQTTWQKLSWLHIAKVLTRTKNLNKSLGQQQSGKQTNNANQPMQQTDLTNNTKSQMNLLLPKCRRATNK